MQRAQPRGDQAPMPSFNKLPLPPIQSPSGGVKTEPWKAGYRSSYPRSNRIPWNPQNPNRTPWITIEHLSDSEDDSDSTDDSDETDNSDYEDHISVYTIPPPESYTAKQALKPTFSPTIIRTPEIYERQAASTVKYGQGHGLQQLPFSSRHYSSRQSGSQSFHALPQTSSAHARTEFPAEPMALLSPLMLSSPRPMGKTLTSHTRQYQRPFYRQAPLTAVVRDKPRDGTDTRVTPTHASTSTSFAHPPNAEPGPSRQGDDLPQQAQASTGQYRSASTARTSQYNIPSTPTPPKPTQHSHSFTQPSMYRPPSSQRPSFPSSFTQEGPTQPSDTRAAIVHHSTPSPNQTPRIGQPRPIPFAQSQFSQITGSHPLQRPFQESISQRIRLQRPPSEASFNSPSTTGQLSPAFSYQSSSAYSTGTIPTLTLSPGFI
ncbi:hypothetical protein FA15DRAFT_756964 [Coprinopsis marcescibilis]|uniref:Uncharacterized protein n=1 Tax=Coprinopsis marcescibilis TaxID=230819 RepID=A0A5C3KT89_COPMA|nr:hypothetical protein FA15DRAFT_756964 [Coprinopsis marcescibilis]